MTQPPESPCPTALVQHEHDPDQLPPAHDQSAPSPTEPSSRLPPVLQAAHHGREILCVTLLPGCSRRHLPWVAVTGSEDGTIRRALYSPQEPAKGIHSSALVGEHVSGTAVRALAAVALGVGEKSLAIGCPSNI